jgi:lambda family phage portal protein
MKIPFFGLEISRKKSLPPERRRDFSAAKISNSVNDFTQSLCDLNEDIKGGLYRIRARTRDRAKNSCWYRRYIESSQRNILGPNGIRLNVRARNPDGQLDAFANTDIETAFSDWGKPLNCTPAGTLSWYDLQLWAVQSMKVDGEFFFQKVRGEGAGKYGYALHPIDPALCDVAYSQDWQPGKATNIINGVEVDRWNRPLAYYFTDSVSCLGGTWSRSGSHHRRIPADEIIHGFWTEGAGQTRGFPDAVGALLALHHIDKVSEAEVIAVRAAACKMGFYKPEPGAGGPGNLGDGKDGADLVSEAEPGIWQILPKGYDAKSYDPTHPTANYRDFVKVQLREIAAGLRLSYNDFANDLEGVNFSSIRGGVLAERDSWMVQQQWWVDHLCRPVFAEWLRMYLLSGTTNLPMAKYDKFHADSWIPRRWQWVDPLKDAEACKLQREQGWKSDSQIVAEQGNDLDEVMEQIEADTETQDSIGFAKPVKEPITVDTSANGKDDVE